MQHGVCTEIVLGIHFCCVLYKEKVMGGEKGDGLYEFCHFGNCRIATISGEETGSNESQLVCKFAVWIRLPEACA